MPQAPVMLDDIPFEALVADPYPAFDRIRPLGSAVHVASANLTLITRYDDILTVESDPGTFSSSNPGSLMHKFMGHTLMRKDFGAHASERKALAPSFSPAMAKRHWGPLFEDIANRLIDGFIDQGRADLFEVFAAPMASLSLLKMLGFHEDIAWQDLAGWSQALMDGCANYADDPRVTARGLTAGVAIDIAIADVIEAHRATQSPAVLSSASHAEDPQTLDQIRANVKVIIGGGPNEPRDAILTMVQGLLENPVQRAAVAADTNLFQAAFDEALRWVAPIGMYPRRVAKDAVLGDTGLKEGTQIGICVGAANRDAACFNSPHAFDIYRKDARHVAFGRGAHFCAGAFVSRQMVGAVAVPLLFERLKNLRLDPAQPPEMRGWVFRGPVTLPVIWDP